MTAAGETEVQQLHHLARLYGVQTAYYDVIARQRRRAPPEALLAVLKALEAPVEGLQDVPAAVRARTEALWQRSTEPVVVAWEGQPCDLELRLPLTMANSAGACQLHLESGEVRSWACELSRLPTLQVAEQEGTRYVSKSLSLPGGLPWGYHRFTLEIQGRPFETLVIAAPLHAYAPPQDAQGRGICGIYLPLYALHSQRSPGSGDLSDLEAFMEWGVGQGSGVVGTLPLLAAFLDDPFDPSPYAPASRLFWNEFYIDVSLIPESDRSPAAQALLASLLLPQELKALGASALVDYRHAMALKRKILEELARRFFAEVSGRHAAFRRFLEAHPRVEDYARFRAVCERRHTPWPAWPQPLRDGVLQEGDYDEEAKRYHLYVQWLAHEQLEALANKSRQKGPGLYLDLPLGVHRAGYDVWREPKVFALEASGGAPPDAFFTKGQNWGFPPLHPEKIR